MTPQPDTVEKQIPPSCHDIAIDDVLENQQATTVIDHESNESSDEHEYFDVENNSEYAGYKLLQQDDGDAIASSLAIDSDESSDDDAEQSHVGSSFCSIGACDASSSDQQYDINYQDLICSGIDDDVTIRESDPALTGEGDNEIENNEVNVASDSNEAIRNMSQEHAEKVKNAMSGFQLPSVNIPNWAVNISDDDWKKTLQESVNKFK